MKSVVDIVDIVNKNERAIAVFTTHDEWSSNLAFNSDGTGHTGDWVIRKNPNIEIIVIYHRVGSTNSIYKASIMSIEGPLKEYDNANRYRITFSECSQVGETNQTWSDFADCGANPVRYINT